MQRHLMPKCACARTCDLHNYMLSSMLIYCLLVCLFACLLVCLLVRLVLLTGFQLVVVRKNFLLLGGASFPEGI